jgi:hypothetical protein
MIWRLLRCRWWNLELTDTQARLYDEIVEHKPVCLMASDKRAWAWSWLRQCSCGYELQEYKLKFKLDASVDSNRYDTEFRRTGLKIPLISTYKLNASPFIWCHQTNGLVDSKWIIKTFFAGILVFFNSVNVCDLLCRLLYQFFKGGTFLACETGLFGLVDVGIVCSLSASQKKSTGLRVLLMCQFIHLDSGWF